MKRIQAILMVVLLLISSSLSAYAEPWSDVKVYVDGEAVLMKEAPVNHNGRVYVEAEALAGALGVRFMWDYYSNSVTLFNEKHFVTTSLGSDVIVLDGVPKSVDGISILMNNKVMISARNVSECFDKYVVWGEADKTVNISSEKPTISNYEGCNLTDFGVFSGIETEYSEVINEQDGGITYTYKYPVSRFNMYASGMVHNYLNEIVNNGWVTDGKKYEVPEENMMYYYFEKDNCHAAVSFVRDAAENVYTLWVTYTIY